MKCPHCLVHFHEKAECFQVGVDAHAAWSLLYMRCPNPACGNMVILLGKHKRIQMPSGSYGFGNVEWEKLVWPKGTNRPPVPPEVPKEIAEDYTEACLVLADSPKASAALSRRCLQHLLRNKASVKPGDLADEIQQVIESRQLPSHLTEAVDAVRNIGNFAAHPLKSKSSGELVPVEPGEAEWTLDVLESIFDFYFVQPEVLKRRKEALNKKLEDAGKPKVKGAVPPASVQ